MNIVITSGKYDPIHAGHLDNIKKSRVFGDFMFIITHQDDIVEKFSNKKFCAVPLQARVDLLNGIMKEYGINGMVVVNDDVVPDCIKSLRYIRGLFPLAEIVYARGGDRTPENMYKPEWDVCKELNIKVQFGVGDLLASSSDIAKRSRV